MNWRWLAEHLWFPIAVGLAIGIPLVLLARAA